MSCIILPKNIECAIIDSPREGYYLMVNNRTAWVAGLVVDFENKTYKITIIFDHDDDKVSLRYFREFLEGNGWKPE